MKHLLAIPVTLLAACGGSSPPPAGCDPGEPMVTCTYAEYDGDVANPERGLFRAGHLLDTGDDFSSVRRNGSTVMLDRVQLDDYRDADLPQEFLDTLDAGFTRVRQAGIKLILRFAYNSGPPDPDASLDRMLGHIDQLTPLLQANADLIAVMHAGFIGDWGEWHDSQNGNDTETARRALVEALLDALPPTRMIQLRTPMFKDELYGGGPLTASDAFSGEPAARLGHDNDCFLASSSDEGTYDDPIERWKDYVATDGLYTPVGGDTCKLNPPRTDCASALAELERLHWSLLNGIYKEDVLARLDAGGCLEEIRRRLGYRFVLDRASFPARVAPGGELSLTVELHNAGWASPYNPHPVQVVLGVDDTEQRVTLASVDPRLWQAGESVTIDVRLRVPATLAPGPYRLALALPDPEPRLAARRTYAIRFANDDTWDPDRGVNILTGTLQIDPDAPGPVDPQATELSEI